MFHPFWIRSKVCVCVRAFAFLQAWVIEGRVFLLPTVAKGICRSFSHDQMDSVRLRLKLDRARRDRLLQSHPVSFYFIFFFFLVSPFSVFLSYSRP